MPLSASSSRSRFSTMVSSSGDAQAGDLGRVQELSTVGRYLLRGGWAHFLALFGMLIEPGLAALARDLDSDVLVGDLRLTAQPRGRAHVERLIQDVLFLLELLRERVESLAHVDVAGRAGAHAATSVAHLRVTAFGRLQDRGALLHLDGVAVGQEGD